MEILKHFKSGYEQFQDDYFHKHEAKYRELAEKGQAPSTMIVSCVDSRVAPETILGVEPGEIFVVRNVGNLVPSFEDELHNHGFSAALEFAVEVLGIRNIVVMGHAKCGAIKGAIATEKDPNSLGTDHVDKWIQIAHEAMHKPGCCCDSIKEGNRIPREIEQASVLNSVNNLKSYPFVQSKLADGDMHLGGWYFDIEDGQIYGFEPEKGTFEPLS